MKALRVKPISQVINMFSLNLFRSCIMSNSSTSSFYSYLYHVRNGKYVGKTLIGRVMEFCRAENIDIMKYVINDDYMKRVKHDLSKPVQDGVDGIVDSLRYMFRSYTPYNRNMTQYLLKLF